MMTNMKEFEGFNGTVDIIDYNYGDIIDLELDPKEVESLIEGIYRIVSIEKNIYRNGVLDVFVEEIED